MFGNSFACANYPATSKRLPVILEDDTVIESGKAETNGLFIIRLMRMMKPAVLGSIRGHKIRYKNRQIKSWRFSPSNTHGRRQWL